MITLKDVGLALTEMARIEGREFSQEQARTWHRMLTSRLPEDVTAQELNDAVTHFYTDPEQRGRLYPRDVIRSVEQSRKVTLWNMTNGENERLAAERAEWERAHRHSADDPCSLGCPPRDPARLSEVTA